MGHFPCRKLLVYQFGSLNPILQIQCDSRGESPHPQLRWVSHHIRSFLLVIHLLLLYHIPSFGCWLYIYIYICIHIHIHIMYNIHIYIYIIIAGFLAVCIATSQNHIPIIRVLPKASHPLAASIFRAASAFNLGDRKNLESSPWLA